MRQGLVNLEDTSLWLGMEATEKTASQIFRTVSRVLGGIFDLLITRFRTWPLRLVDLLGDQWQREIAVAELLSAPACMLDEFTLSLRQSHSTLEKLSDPHFLACLRVMLGEVAGNTYDVECTHSRNLRKQRARVMTTNIELADLAVGLVGDSRPFVAAALKEKRSGLSQKRPKTLKDENQSGHRRKGGGGGAWRAFIHAEGQVRVAAPRLRQRCDLGALAIAYAQLPGDRRRMFEEAGAAATRRYREGLQSFPPTLKRSYQDVGLSAADILPSQPVQNRPSNRSASGLLQLLSQGDKDSSPTPRAPKTAKLIHRCSHTGPSLRVG